MPEKRYHWSSSQALELMLKTFRMIALPALTRTITSTSQYTAFPMRSFIASMRRASFIRASKGSSSEVRRGALMGAVASVRIIGERHKGETLRKWMTLWAAMLVATTVHAVEVGQPMPSVPAAKAFETGAPAVDLAAYRGKVLYVDFWASWCVPCRTSMPALEALYRKYGDKGFVVVGVNKDDRVTDARRFLEKFPASFPLATDTDEKVVRAFNVAAMPSGYLIDRRGVVRRVHQGFTAETAASLEREVQGLLQGAS